MGLYQAQENDRIARQNGSKPELVPDPWAALFKEDDA